MGVGVIVMEVPRISFRSAIFVCTVLEQVMPTADLTGGVIGNIVGSATGISFSPGRTPLMCGSGASCLSG